MGLALGIDTGGTYTDAVLVEYESGTVIAGAKALTTRNDLAVGIDGAIRAVFTQAALDGAVVAPNDVTLVALSTTLATNALAENHRGTVALLLIGYDPGLMRQYNFERELATDDIVYIAGGHDGLGDEVALLDEEAARDAILARRERVEAFAVSGYFGVRNPGHELRVKALIEELTTAPVTCGHELTSQLNAVRRATTAALNAHLIFPLQELIAAVQDTLTARGIHAVLMIVKGDGSLVRAEWAMHRPIETILSGPAASVVGAWHLAGRRDVWTVDVGGTTTDIAALRDGLPMLNVDGARVGGWRTMIEAVDVHTTGLGGDSHVCVEREGGLTIGPRRAVPLALLAHEFPQVVDALRYLTAAPPRRWDDTYIEFGVLGRSARRGLLDESEKAILSRLAAGPVSLAELVERTRIGSLNRRRVEELEERGLLRRAAFTPTDALHALGRFTRWQAEASQLAGSLLAERAGLSLTDFCERVVSQFSERVATELVNKTLEDEVGRPDWDREPTAAALLRRALTNGKVRRSDLACALTLGRPLVAIGAPVAAYLPQVAESLHTELVIPPHSDVANAVGAVSGSIIQRQHVVISPLGGDGAVRLHLPDGVHDFAGIELAVAFAGEVVPARLRAQARAVGAEHVEMRMARQDRLAPVNTGSDQTLFLGSDLTFTAAGRPSPARIGQDLR